MSDPEAPKPGSLPASPAQTAPEGPSGAGTGTEEPRGELPPAQGGAPSGWEAQGYGAAPLPPSLPDGSAVPYNPYGPPPGAGYALSQAPHPGSPYGGPPGGAPLGLPSADPSQPYGPPPGSLQVLYGPPSARPGLPPGPPFPGIIGFLVLVLIGFAMNAGIGAVGMLVAALVGGADAKTLTSGEILDAVPLSALLGVLFLASMAWPGVALVGAKLMRSWSRASFRLRWPGTLSCGLSILMGLGLVPVALALEHGMSRLVPRGRNELMEMMTRHPDALALTILGVTLVVSAPLGEELLFRGLSLRGIERRYGFVVSALLVSLVFAGVHLNLTGFGALFLVSLVLCWVSSRLDSILPAILLHAAYNGFQFAMLAMGDYSEAAVRKAMAQQDLAMPVWVVIAAAGITALGGLAIHRFAPPRPGDGGGDGGGGGLAAQA